MSKTNPLAPRNIFPPLLGKKHWELENALPTWDATWVAANWSAPIIPLKAWRKAIRESSAESCWLLENAIEYLPAWGFINWYGQENFRKTWPSIRGYCPMRLFSKRAILDMYWSVLETGSFRIQPLDAWFELTPGEKAFLRNIMKSEGRPVETVLSLCKEPDPANCLQRLIESGFLFEDKGRIWRNTTHEEAQSPRKPVTRTFLIKGERVTFSSSDRW